MIPFSPPYINEATIEEISDTLRSGWITTGPKTKLFEKKLEEYCGNKRTLCVSSATFGLEMMLRWFGVKEGDEVIIPAYTYCATANVVLHLGAKVVMVDVNKDDFNINVKEIEKHVNAKTKAIIPVDFSGYPCDYNEIFKLVKSNDVQDLFTADGDVQKKHGRILVLSDAAHSLGASYNGRKTGTLADVTVFSFHAVKNLTTGEGGAVALNFDESFDCDELYKYLNIHSLHGQSKDALAKTQVGNWRYDVVEAGYKGNMTDIQACLGLSAMKDYESVALLKRKEIFKYYNNAFSPYGWAEIPASLSEEKESSYHVYALRIKEISEKERDEVIQNIFDKGVSVNVHFQPLPLLTAYRKQGLNIDDFPISFDNYSREISIPVYVNLSESNLDCICDAVVKSVDEVLNKRENENK